MIVVTTQMGCDLMPESGVVSPAVWLTLSLCTALVALSPGEAKPCFSPPGAAQGAGGSLLCGPEELMG